MYNVEVLEEMDGVDVMKSYLLSLINKKRTEYW